jgi:hypothetical protein
MIKTVLICTLLLLTGCSTQPVEMVKYYILNSVESTSQNPSQHTVPQKLASVEISLSDYLKQANLAMQLQSHQLYYSKKHLWAEPLQTGIQRALLSDLNNNFSETTFITATTGHVKQPDMYLTISIEHFVATHDSQAIIVGHYWIINNHLNSLEPYQPINFRFSKPLEQDGYPHAVSQLRLLLKELSSAIQKSIQES